MRLDTQPQNWFHGLGTEDASLHSVENNHKIDGDTLIQNPFPPRMATIS